MVPAKVKRSMMDAERRVSEKVRSSGRTAGSR
jgi:hypothetical protein